jgi:hypothetical protein
MKLGVNDIQRIETRDFRYAQYRNLLNVMLSAVILLSVIILTVVMPSVVTPLGPFKISESSSVK